MSAQSRLERVEGQLAQQGHGDIPARREQLLRARDEIRALIDQTNCHPIMVRLAWHDSGTYDKRVQQWPQCGGANGSIRFEPELGHGANAGLVKAIGYLRPIKQKYPLASWADLIQLASAVAIELAGGPAVPMRYGRVDVATADQCPKEGNLPGAAPPFGDGAKDAATHLRNVFHRMGFTDQEIVALSGAHTIGRAFKDRSGTVAEGPGAANGTRFTCGAAVARGDGKQGVGMPGGRSWTEKWLSFDNSYFQQAKRQSQEGLLWLPTDKALQDDPGFRPHFDRYAASQDAFFREYAAAHRKLSELGSKFDPPEGFAL